MCSEACASFWHNRVFSIKHDISTYSFEEGTKKVFVNKYVPHFRHNWGTYGYPCFDYTIFEWVLLWP